MITLPQDLDLIRTFQLQEISKHYYYWFVLVSRSDFGTKYLFEYFKIFNNKPSLPTFMSYTAMVWQKISITLICS